MQIKRKADIEHVLDHFPSLAEWDKAGAKHYLVFEDRKRGGQWTLMRYNGGRFSLHGRGASYSDADERFFDDRDSLVSFLWDNRAAFNSAVRQAS